MSTTTTTVKLPALHDVLLAATEDLLRDSANLSLNLPNGFNCWYWDGSDSGTLTVLQPVLDLLLSNEFREATELNLNVANQGGDWREHPVVWVVAGYLNDLLSYTIPRLAGLENWKEVFEGIYRRFEHEYLSDEVTLEVYGHLGNFSYQFSDMGELNDHTRIVVPTLAGPMSTEHLCGKRADLLRIRATLASSGHQVDRCWEEQRQFLRYETRVSKRELHATYNVRELADELVRKFILGVRVLSPSHAKPYCDFAVVFHSGRLSGSMLGHARPFPEDRIEETGWVDFEWNTWLQRVWAQLEQTDYTAKLLALDTHLDDSLKRSNRSAKNPYSRRLQIIDELERLSDYFSAFDSIYKENIKGDTAKKLANLTAHLMTHQWGDRSIRQQNEYETVSSEVSTMYQTRNDYEHGRVYDVLRKSERPDDFKKKVQSIGYYLKQTAIIYIMNHDFDAQVPKIRDGDCAALQHIYC